ncbi:MAG: sigma 54-interacting transcriptional regulator, partial [Myxococcales bacterium]|nr:sigma 54-interacting transcriptional regulator [Myxococcales bacterium]
MTDALSLRHALGHDHVWQATRAMLERLVTALGQDEYLDAFLDTVVDLLGADRGLLVVSYPDGATQVVNARGGSRALSAREREEVSKTVVARALAEGRVVCWDPFGDGDATRSMADLGIWMALAAPVSTPAWRRESANDEPPPRGALYVDFRDRRKLVGPLHQEFFATAALLLGGLVEQGRRLDVAHALLRETRAERREEHAPPGLDELLRPPGMASLRDEVRSLTLGESPFVILGESGTGKTQLARAIAEASGRRPVVRAMLGASDDLNTITSELFGHERGAFTGAVTRRRGLVEHADGGTLVLDELLNLPLHAQRLLLDFTQFGTFRPLGHPGPEPKRAKVRLIAATNGDLERALAEGTLREDLYYRLAGAVLRVPPLRERR